MIISHLLDPKVLVTLDDPQMRSISAALQAELLQDPQIMKVLKERVKPFASALERSAGKK
jgi:hypothetical protein